MEFRKSVKSDIKDIMKIIVQAQLYLKEQGVDQWQNNYPNEEVIENDIFNKISYVLLKDKNIVATAAISFDGEKTYENIYDGNWISDYEYAVVHRIAVDNNYKRLGLASKIMKNVENTCLDKGIRSIKIDTHEDNLSMQNFLKNNGFKYCGVIYLEDKSKRIAFEKILD
ncbi:GNAT family N-acetyltransferase [Clostridium fallax]|uniref:Ribosomal protein S18 acetylase RimI n=1 Tax=Clostridium fallax TaxID=1533 RepID=A0A1M4XUP4_9CLOT|nr:GNAT family N-acetyltransferase [Clostridium fallax]SHE97155.1 Ribosomal protein S18 acetylase RimI [Clostridium fallax]SQB06529.1 N-acetyltransferase GCN5 [Clostridium fallax]